MSDPPARISAISVCKAAAPYCRPRTPRRHSGGWQYPALVGRCLLMKASQASALRRHRLNSCSSPSSGICGCSRATLRSCHSCGIADFHWLGGLALARTGGCCRSVFNSEGRLARTNAPWPVILSSDGGKRANSACSARRSLHRAPTLIGSTLPFPASAVSGDQRRVELVSRLFPVSFELTVHFGGMCRRGSMRDRLERVPAMLCATARTSNSRLRLGGA